MTEELVDGKAVDYTGLPDKYIPGVRRYLEDGIPPGSFMTRVICGKLDAVLLADDDMSIGGLCGIVRWWHNYAPATSYGSLDRMAAWALEHK